MTDATLMKPDSTMKMQPASTLNQSAGPMVRFAPTVAQVSVFAESNHRAKRKARVLVLVCFSVAIVVSSLA